MTKPIFPRSQVKTRTRFRSHNRILVFQIPDNRVCRADGPGRRVGLDDDINGGLDREENRFLKIFRCQRGDFLRAALYALLSAPFSPVDPVQSAVRSLRLFSEFLTIAVFLWCLLRVPGELGREIVLSFCCGCLAAIVVGGFMGGVFDPGGSLLRTGRMSEHAGNLLSRGLAILAIVSMPLSIWLTGAGRARRWLRASMFVFLLAAL